VNWLVRAEISTTTDRIKLEHINRAKMMWRWMLDGTLTNNVLDALVSFADDKVLFTGVAILWPMANGRIQHLWIGRRTRFTRFFNKWNSSSAAWSSYRKLVY
jgi:hypothetical protein